MTPTGTLHAAHGEDLIVRHEMGGPRPGRVGERVVARPRHSTNNSPNDLVIPDYLYRNLQDHETFSCSPGAGCTILIP